MTDIRNFINSFIPENIPKKKRQQLYDEIECHILDRADFYVEIGYDEETALKKSMECFGEENEMRESVKKDFEELYRERWYYALIAGIIPLTFNTIIGFTGAFIHSADKLGDPSDSAVFISSLSVGYVILQIAFCFMKGYRKSLIATGISNLLIMCSLILIAYPQSAFFALALNVSYLLEKFTPLIMKGVADSLPDLLSFSGTCVFIISIAAVSYVLAGIVKRKGKHEQKTLKIFSVLSIVIVTLSFFSSVIYSNADDYYRDYRTWFNPRNDTVTEKTLTVFNSVPLGCTYKDTKPYLEHLGYVNTEDYIKTLSREEKKMFRYNISEMDFSFDGEYMIFFEKEKKSYNSDDNGFIFIKTDENGLINGKGIGVACPFEDKYGSKHHYCGEVFDTGKCEEAFINTEKGDSKDEVLKKFAKENGHLYSLFSETENGVQKDYCRIHSYGSPSTYNLNDYNKDRDIFIQLWFTDGKLEKADFEYYDFQYNKEVIREIK